MMERGDGKAWKLAGPTGAHLAEVVTVGSLWRWAVIVPS
jgi:hypothetical protein